MINNCNRDLVIIGASGLGKEIAFLAKRVGIPIRGFLDDNIINSQFYGYPVLGKINSIEQESNVQYIIAIANPSIRQSLASKLENLCFATLIDPSVIYDSSQLAIGNGTVVLAGSICTANISIGEHSIINKLCSIGHDANIQAFTTLSPMVMIGGNVIIEGLVELGARTTVKQGVTISQNITTGMSTTVVKNLLEPGIYIGTPAKILKSL